MSDLHAVLAEFEKPENLVKAVEAMKQKGFSDMEAYAPMPVEGLKPLRRLKNRRIDLAALAGAVFGASLGMAITVGQNVLQYPINVGGRPLFSWPAFLVPSFELGVLFGCFGAFIGFFIASGLPRLHNPIFEVDGFFRASEDRFFLAVFAGDAKFDDARAALESLSPAALHEAPA
ncbi:MAG: DUF3341 domain-containing protein [Oceanicaulis sp.]